MHMHTDISLKKILDEQDLFHFTQDIQRLYKNTEELHM